MIKYEAEKGNVKTLGVSGNVLDIVANVAQMIYLVYEGLKEHNEVAAEDFKKFICFSVKDDGIVFSECCEADALNKINKQIDDIHEINKQLDDLLNKIKAMGAEE